MSLTARNIGLWLRKFTGRSTVSTDDTLFQRITPDRLKAFINNVWPLLEERKRLHDDPIATEIFVGNVQAMSSLAKLFNPADFLLDYSTGEIERIIPKEKTKEQRKKEEEYERKIADVNIRLYTVLGLFRDDVILLLKNYEKLTVVFEKLNIDEITRLREIFDNFPARELESSESLFHSLTDSKKQCQRFVSFLEPFLQKASLF